MENLNRYKKLNEYLKNKFGERTLKICVDGGFTCPNRDGTINNNGCIFCSERGSGEHILKDKNMDISSSEYISNYKSCNNIDIIAKKINQQVENHFSSYKSDRANKFIVYFQNFTNTYDSIDNLKKKYDSALINDKIVGLEIATRPDCINEDICTLLKSYTDKYYVCVELGLQTSNENTAKFINRGYDNSVFTNAVNMLKSYGIDVVVHIMIGLPGEDKNDLSNTIDFVNNHPINGIKIHNVYVVKNTVLADLYYKKLYVPIDFDEYMDCLTFTITHLRPDIIIHRISGDAPKDLLIAPQWNMHKKWVLNGLDNILKEKNLSQGCYYN
jgi:hypothetical protein